MEERLEVIPLGNNDTFFVLPHNIEWESSVAKSALSRIRSRLNGAARRKSDRARCSTNFVAKLAQHCASHFELFGLSLRQLRRW